MFFGVCKFELFIPQSGSLKQKRSVINSLKDRIRNRWHVSVAEVATQDLRQRGTLGVSLVGTSPGALDAALEAMRRLVDEEPRATVTKWEVRVEPFDGAAAAPRDLTLSVERFRSHGENQIACTADQTDDALDWDSDEEDDEYFGPRKEQPEEKE
jgi:uncharacterized protein